MTSHRSAAKRRSTAFLEFRLVPQVFSDLTDMLRDVVNRVREQERLILDICVNECACRAATSSPRSQKRDQSGLGRPTRPRASKPTPATSQHAVTTSRADQIQAADIEQFCTIDHQRYQGDQSPHVDR